MYIASNWICLTCEYFSSTFVHLVLLSCVHWKAGEEWLTLETCPMVSCVTGSSLVQMLPSVCSTVYLQFYCYVYVVIEWLCNSIVIPCGLNVGVMLWLLSVFAWMPLFFVCYIQVSTTLVITNQEFYQLWCYIQCHYYESNIMVICLF